MNQDDSLSQQREAKSCSQACQLRFFRDDYVGDVPCS